MDWEQQVLRVRQSVTTVGGKAHVGPPKSKKGSRDIQGIPPAVLAALREHRVKQNEIRLWRGPEWQDHDLVFCTTFGTPIHPCNLAHDYNRWIKVAGVPRIRVHDARHTNASLLLQMGIDIKVVSERLGHARTSITVDVYSHVTSRQHVEAGQRIGNAPFGPSLGLPEGSSSAEAGL